MNTLARSLGPVSGTAMMINTVLGAGILTLPGLAAQSIGGMSIWTWILCALASVPLLIMFAILAGKYPSAGGVGAIAKNAFGDYGNTITSFLFLGAVFVGLPSIALTGGYYLAEVIDIPISVLAFIILFIATLMNLALPEIASKIGTYIAICVIIFIVILVVSSALVLFSEPQSYTKNTPLMPPPDASALVPFMLVFFAFTGWEVAIGSSEEFKDPSRNIPIATGASFTIAILFYIACSVVVILSGEEHYNNAPFLTILSPHGGSWIRVVIAIGTGIIICANLFAAIWAVSRLLFSLSRDGYLPSFMSKVQKETPRWAVLFTGLFLILVVLLDSMDLVNITILFSIAGQNFILIYAISSAALFKLERGYAARAVSVISLALVAGLVYYAGLNLIYPVILTLIGLALAFKHRTVAVNNA